MIQSDVLDVAIGVVFVWFVLSLVISLANESIGLLTRVRAKYLWHGISELIDGQVGGLPTRLRDALLKVPFGGVLDKLGWWKGGDPRPRRTSSASPSRQQQIYDALNIEIAELAEGTRKTKATNVPAEAFVAAVEEVATPADGPVTAQSIQDWFAHDNPALDKAIGKAIAGLGASEQLEAAKKTVETWFDREMDRVSAVYRRQSRKVLVLLSLPVVLFFQANVIGLVDDLRDDAALRSAMASQAAALGASADVTAATEELCETAETTDSTTELEASKARLECAASVVRSATKFDLFPDGDAIRELSDDDDGTAKDSLTLSDIVRYERQDLGLIGRLVTAIALSFGAQFWFDVLRRLVGMKKPSGPDTGAAG
jgi:hypothetical protein